MKYRAIFHRALRAPVISSLLVASAVMAGAAGAQAPCALTVDDPIPIGSEPATVTVKLSIPVGDSLSVTFPDESKVEVMSIKHVKTDPNRATLIIGTLHATAGQWNVSIRGEKGTCTGKVWIGQGLKEKKGNAPHTQNAVAVSSPERLYQKSA